jgi:hypothetical protein
MKKIAATFVGKNPRLLKNSSAERLCTILLAGEKPRPLQARERIESDELCSRC